MRRVLAAVLGGMLVAGPMGGCASIGGSSGRLDVTYALRQACSGSTVPEIKQIMTVVEQARVDGTSKGATLSVFYSACGGDVTTSAACIVCTAAIIGQVYGG
jgi:hypothetical protein